MAGEDEWRSRWSGHYSPDCERGNRSMKVRTQGPHRGRKRLFLPSQDAQEVMLVTESVSELLIEQLNTHNYLQMLSSRDLTGVTLVSEDEI